MCRRRPATIRHRIPLRPRGARGALVEDTLSSTRMEGCARTMRKGGSEIAMVVAFLLCASTVLPFSSIGPGVARARNIDIVWSPNGTREYRETPLIVALGDNLYFHCQINRTLDSISLLPGESEYNKCNESSQDLLFLCTSKAAEGRGTYVLQIQGSGTTVGTSLSFSIDTRYYFGSVHPDGGTCMQDDLKMVMLIVDNIPCEETFAVAPDPNTAILTVSLRASCAEQYTASIKICNCTTNSTSDVIVEMEDLNFDSNGLIRTFPEGFQVATLHCYEVTFFLKQGNSQVGEAWEGSFEYVQRPCDSDRGCGRCDSEGVVCVECATGYKMGEPSTGVCNQCAEGYEVEGQEFKCVPSATTGCSIEFCEQCVMDKDGGVVCADCQAPGHTPSSDGKECVCADGWVAGGDGKCSYIETTQGTARACTLDGCLVCEGESSERCVECVRGYVLDERDEKCVLCEKDDCSTTTDSVVGGGCSLKQSYYWQLPLAVSLLSLLSTVVGPQ